ncbi:MAG: putative stress-responsive transcriptional regulator [Bacillota bacterium]|jgi:phage shock protein PspC (stress-responsive transcriptional regulator)|nr:putative stress-responsive transcriptional regulator [Bacillota bacterium]
MKTILPLLILSMIPLAFIILAIRSSKNNRDRYYQGNEYRMLCRSQNNRVIAGVCGGIAEYFGWSATIVRLFFVLTGVGVFTYIILAIVLPDSPSSLL